MIALEKIKNFKNELIGKSNIFRERREGEKKNPRSFGKNEAKIYKRKVKFLKIFEKSATEKKSKRRQKKF